MLKIAPGFNPKYQEDVITLSEIENIPGYALLEFGTQWCGHCQAAAPAVESAMSAVNLWHIKVLDGKGQRLGRSFKVKLWPTLILLHDGCEVARLVRPTRAQEVEALLSPAGEQG
jgi:thioredoxin 1